ncbi:MAG: hypothetical protein M3003_10495 [Candidatus Dormibacteraeota bacterium]|nr:hypothetical protein [Candidatus Dormibacteraeota bacterium]
MSDTITWADVLNHIGTAWAAGYDQGYTDGRNTRADDDDHAAAHHHACTVIGLHPHDSPPQWAITT